MFLTLHFFAKPLSSSQLIDNNCTTSFSRNGNVIEDQKTRKAIGRNPKSRRLFSLTLPTSTLTANETEPKSKYGSIDDDDPSSKRINKAFIGFIKFNKII